MYYENYYEIKTCWGWFRLDERAYRDYLAGKLWICWAPRHLQRSDAEPSQPQTLPPNISDDAVRLRELAVKKGFCPLLQELCGGEAVEVPYRSRMSRIKIEEMNLSVRSSNGLMRAGASTFGKLWELMGGEHGLRSVRNLGAKSEAEIRRCFLAACYAFLSPGEQAAFWQEILNKGNSVPR